MPAVSQRELTRLITKWRRILGIAPQWRIGVRIHEKPQPGGEPEDAHARIEVQPQYYSAELDIYAWNCVGTDMDLVICHEMLHIVMKPTETLVRAAYGKRLEETAEQHTESVVDFLTDAFVRLSRKRR